jgi:molybdopterin-containing oxidoreductase family iron-sulfur binding subunit
LEKCTFCYPRIRRARQEARAEGRDLLVDGDVDTACAQTCPTGAIVFGDANDPDSRVSGLLRSPRGVRMLESLATEPSIVYLKRMSDNV